MLAFISALPLAAQAQEENTSSQAASAEGVQIQAVGTITGQGTTGKIAKFTGTNSIGNSIITESSSKIGIGIATPSSKLTVQGGATNPMILGNNTGSGAGVQGTSTGGFGVIGKSSRTGVQGICTSSVGNGVWGSSPSDTGVFGSTSTGRGVMVTRQATAASECSGKVAQAMVSKEEVQAGRRFTAMEFLACLARAIRAAPASTAIAALEWACMGKHSDDGVFGTNNGTGVHGMANGVGVFGEAGSTGS